MLLLYGSADVERGRPIGLAKAVERIRHGLRMSADGATDILVELAASGKVRSTGVSPLWQHRRAKIQHFWYPRSSQIPTICNLRNSSIANAVDGTITRVELDSRDLEDWLRGQKETSASSPLKQASERQILKAIVAVYDEADRAKTKPPNLNELPALVKKLLHRQRRDASYRRIQQLASDTAHRRRPRGRTQFAERSRPR